MSKTQGSIGRTIAGGAAGSAILAGTVAVEGGDPRFGIFVGAILGLIIGVVIATIVFTRMFRNPVIYFLLGSVVGAVSVLFLANLDFRSGVVITTELSGVLSGAAIGGIIAVIISRGIAEG